MCEDVEGGELAMCDSGTTNEGKTLRVFGPYENPDEPTCYLGEVNGDLSAVIECLRDYLPQMHEGEEIVFRVKAMTDAEVEALPDL